MHFCTKSQECIVDPITGQPNCICLRKCPTYNRRNQRKLCGHNGRLYQNYCELLQDSCYLNQTIRIQKISKCGDENDINITTKTAGAIELNGEQLYSTNVAVTTDPITINEEPPKCSLEQYELMKDNLLLYSHKNLILLNGGESMYSRIKQHNQDQKQQQHNKNFLVSIMFSHYDQNNNGHLEFEELEKISSDENIKNLSDGVCSLVDMLSYDDKNGDQSLSLNEFNQAFNKLYSLSVVSLDKALETNHLSVRIGDNVEIKCDVTGQPIPLIVWQRYSFDLYLLKENENDIDEIRVFNDGSLYITNIQLKHAGNYTCHAQRNKDIVQTHIITVHSEFSLVKFDFSLIIYCNIFF